MLNHPELFTDHEPSRGSGLMVSKISGWVGPGQEVLEISRVGLGRVSRSSKLTGYDMKMGA